MAKLYLLDPEVAGGWGPKTIRAKPPDGGAAHTAVDEVVYLQYQFDGWMRDEIIQFISTFAVTLALADAIRASALSCARFEAMETCVSDQWQQHMQKTILPQFVRLIPDGNVKLNAAGELVSWSGHDFNFGKVVDWRKPANAREVLTLIPPFGLVVSESALDLLSSFQIDECQLLPLKEAR